MQKLGVKICGLKNELDVACAVLSGASFVGFVFFAKSPRNLEFSQIANIKRAIPDKVSSVAVVVDPDDNLLEQIYAELHPDYLQLHGNESVERVREIKRKFKTKIIKAFAAGSVADLDVALKFKDEVDFFLFDSNNKESGYYGGSGKVFNWQILKDFTSAKPYFLSGGINVANIENAIATSEARYIDVSSGVEASRGQKSKAKIKELFKLLKQKYELI
jgi:phosphoribosylanthranilate isomerase